MSFEVSKTPSLSMEANTTLIMRARRRHTQSEVGKRIGRVNVSPLLFAFAAGYGQVLFADAPSPRCEQQLCQLEQRYRRYQLSLETLGFTSKEIEVQALQLLNGRSFNEQIVENFELMADFVSKVDFLSNQKSRVAEIVKAEMARAKRNIAQPVMAALVRYVREQKQEEGLRAVVTDYTGLKRTILLHHFPNGELSRVLLLTETELEQRVAAFKAIEVTNRAGLVFKPFVLNETIYEILTRVSPQRAAENILGIDRKFVVAPEIFIVTPRLAYDQHQETINPESLLTAHINAANYCLGVENLQCRRSYPDTQQVLAAAQVLADTLEEKSCRTKARYLAQKESLLVLCRAEAMANGHSYVEAKDEAAEAYRACLVGDADHPEPRLSLSGFTTVILKRYLNFYQSNLEAQRRQGLIMLGYLKPTNGKLAQVGVFRRKHQQLVAVEAKNLKLELLREMRGIPVPGERLSDEELMFYIAKVFDPGTTPFIFSKAIEVSARQKFSAYARSSSKLPAEDIERILSKGYLGVELSLRAMEKARLIFGLDLSHYKFVGILGRLALERANFSLLNETSALLFAAAESSGLVAISDLTVFRPIEQLDVAEVLFKARGKGRGRLRQAGLDLAANPWRLSPLALESSPLAARFKKIKDSYLVTGQTVVKKKTVLPPQRKVPRRVEPESQPQENTGFFGWDSSKPITPTLPRFSGAVEKSLAVFDLRGFLSVEAEGKPELALAQSALRVLLTGLKQAEPNGENTSLLNFKERLASLLVDGPEKSKLFYYLMVLDNLYRLKMALIASDQSQVMMENRIIFSKLQEMGFPHLDTFTQIQNLTDLAGFCSVLLAE